MMEIEDSSHAPCHDRQSGRLRYSYHAGPTAAGKYRSDRSKINGDQRGRRCGDLVTTVPVSEEGACCVTTPPPGLQRFGST